MSETRLVTRAFTASFLVPLCFFLPHLFTPVTRSLCRSTKSCRGHAGGKKRRGRGLGKKVAEERRISIDIGSTGEGEQAGRKGPGRGECKEGGPPKHVGRNACTLQWWWS